MRNTNNNASNNIKIASCLHGRNSGSRMDGEKRDFIFITKARIRCVCRSTEKAADVNCEAASPRKRNFMAIKSLRPSMEG